MSLKSIKHNSELVNAYNNYIEVLSRFNSIKEIHQKEKSDLEKFQDEQFAKLKNELIEKIGILTLNKNFSEIALEEEKKEIQELLCQLS